MKADNQIVLDSKAFAIRIIKLYKYLSEEKKEFVMSKQVLRSGTSIGANVSESIFAQSRMDFVSKMSIALKEASETKYWLELLMETEYINDTQFDSINDDIGRIIGTLVNIVNSTKSHNV
ncbi:four helix bundle protein [Prevotella sp. E2-28]|jgi:four helix bundle protein|uniref:four helix bundle protein n=1 Tax=Prevotella sp. E2-28 TaxID=2913620 RepID=UPI001EDB3CBE|nr:four helix bundle protein [Prevotella sp. E2-28]UKK54839.1 four helix bundle protein [Prevotella sp. E2-28]